MLGAHTIRQRMYKRAFLKQDVRDDGHNPLHFAPAIVKTVGEDGNVVIRVLTCITACSRAEQHEALKSLAVHIR